MVIFEIVNQFFNRPFFEITSDDYPRKVGFSSTTRAISPGLGNFFAIGTGLSTNRKNILPTGETKPLAFLLATKTIFRKDKIKQKRLGARDEFKSLLVHIPGGKAT